jgi:Fe-S oxidoreductase
MLEQYQDMLERCSLCHDFCVFACPALNATKVQTVAPSRKAQIVDLLCRGVLSASPDVAEILYQCTSCRLCKTWCLYNDVDVSAFLRAARTHVIDNVDEVVLPSYVVKIRENAEHFGSPYGPSEKRRDEEAAKALVQMASEEGEVLFFAGCTTRLFQPEIAVAALRVLEALGIDYVFSPEREACCGGPLVDLGFIRLGRNTVEATRDYIESSGCSLVLTNCPRCAYSLTEGYRQLGLSLEAKVMHIAAYFEQFIEEGKIVFGQQVEQKVTIDDAPYMARYLGLVDTLRNILAALPGVDLIEMVPNKEQASPSTCYLGLPDPTIAGAVTAMRLEEARRTGASTIVTASPFCKRDLNSVAGKEFDTTDIVELVAATLLNG